MSDPLYAMHGAAAPGFYGPSVTFPGIPAPMIPVQHSPAYVGSYVPEKQAEVIVEAPRMPNALCLNEHAGPHRAVLWAGLLAFFSTATFVNGMERFLQAWPTAKVDGGNLTENDSYFPPIVPLIAAIFAIVIGLTGFLTGLGSVLYGAVKPGTAGIAFLAVLILGSYVFVIEVFAKPIFEYTKRVGYFPFGSMIAFPEGVNVYDQNASVTFSSVFTLFSYFFTSVGMIALCALELKNALGNLAETVKGAQMKERFMSLMVFMNGLGVLVIGCIVYLDEEDERLINQKWIAFPQFIEFPSIIVMTGIFLCIYATPGLLATVAMAKIQGWLAIPMFLWMVCCHWLLQLAHFTALFSFMGGLFGILSLMNIAAPVVYGGRVVALSKTF